MEGKRARLLAAYRGARGQGWMYPLVELCERLDTSAVDLEEWMDCEDLGYGELKRQRWMDGEEFGCNAFKQRWLTAGALC